MKRQITTICLLATCALAIAQDAQPDETPQGTEQAAGQNSAPQDATATEQQADAATSGQQDSASTPAADDNFPPPPSSTVAQQQAQAQAAAAAIAASGAANQGTGNASGQQQPVNNNGVANLPPLTPPPEVTDYERAEKMVAPFKQEEVVNLRKQLDSTRKAKANKPLRSVPRISSISVDLSPGSELPIARTLPGEATTLVFVDSTGAPWPLAVAPRISDDRFFSVEWLKGTPSVVISALSAYEEGNVTVFLAGMPTPIVVKLATGEPDAKSKTRIVDYRLDLRIPGRGPNAQTAFMGSNRVSLYDDVLQRFLDGMPPEDARQVTMHGIPPARTQVWQYNNELFVRTQNDIQTAFDQSMFAADGTRIYRLPLTPYITLSEAGTAVTLQLDIQ